METFFLSEAFLKVQFSESFGRRLISYLTGPGLLVCVPEDYPAGFLQELAIAYALVPYFQGEKLSGLLPGREWAAKIFDLGTEECDLRRKATGRLRQPGNKARYNGFSDYGAIREMSVKGELTEENRGQWERILNMCQVHYLYERNGKQMGWGDYESRSECVVKLYVQWLKEEPLPECVLTYFYKKLALRELDRSSTKGLYGGLKEQVVRQLPRVEELLFGEGGREQAITGLYRAVAGILNDHQTNYDHHVYGESDEIRRRTEEVFARPQWQELKGDRRFFGRLNFVAKRLVMPLSMAKGLLGYLGDGEFPEPERTELAESIFRTLGVEGLCREMDYRYPVSFFDMDRERTWECREFWEYFLMRGFGFRHGKARGKWEEDYIYVKDGECYLPGYVDYLYSPSRAWQKAFVGWDEEREGIRKPVSTSCLMPGGRRLRVEFHYHFCLYFADEEPVMGAALDFSDLRDYEGKIEEAREFFFLLAVTSIGERDREEALRLIEQWLGRISVHPLVRPSIARLLAADNDPLPQGARAVYYGEQERFCFRVIVGDKEGGGWSFKVYRQANYGWQDIIFRQTEFGWQEIGLPLEFRKRALEISSQDKEDGEGIVREILEGLRQPKAVLCGRRDVAGMGLEEKMAAILEAMEFFEKGESYCVLRYGDRKFRRHDRVFYGAQVPFGFDIRAQSRDYERWTEYLASACASKIKEGKWLAARFGWGFKYSTQSDFHPVYVYKGESGNYYAYGTIKMHRRDSIGGVLAELLKEEIEGVTEIERYEGCLSVSRLDRRLEYCYGEADWLESIYREEETGADWFTVFGRYSLWMEFARWLDGILEQGLPGWVNVIVLGLDMGRGGALCVRGICAKRYEDECWAEDEWGMEDEGDAKSDGAPWGGEWDGVWDRDGKQGTQPGGGEYGMEEYEKYCPDVPLLIWGKGLDEERRLDSLREAAKWYAAWKAADERIRAKEIEIMVGFTDG